LHKVHLHDTTSRIRLPFWRIKTTADATIPVHQFMAKYDIFIITRTLSSAEAYMKFLVRESERARSDGKIEIKEASAS
jgi:hypothetical protein